HLGFFVDSVSLFERSPEALVAHDDGVNDAVRVESELVLAEDAEFAGTNDSAFLGIHLTGQDFHEGGLASAVGAGEAVALAVRKGGGDVVKQNFGAVAHGYIAN